MNKPVWTIPPVRAIPEELLRAGYSPLLASVLAARGIVTAEAAAERLACGPDSLIDPFLLKDMDLAVRRIRLACERGETVAVYGDYDADGITAACLLTEYLRGIGLATEIYIPDRTEGYGVNNAAVELLRDRNVTLIITVDTGITAVAETEHAAALGVDVIVTDHHECQADLPRAVAVVDPKRPDDTYPNRYLAGVGVAFKLACALSGDAVGTLDSFADLAAIGTVADVMPLVGENRYIVSRGLEKLREDPCPGLDALIDLTNVNRASMNAAAISYRLAPCINAAGRLFHVAQSSALLLERDPGTARERAEELCGINRTRRELEADIMEQARQLLRGLSEPAAPIVLAREDWHQGVIGIAASRLVDRYRTPVIMISLKGEMGKGSGRSYGDFDLFAALNECRDLLVTFGGHAEAAGLTIEKKNIDAFREALRTYYEAHPPQLRQTLCPDVRIEDPAWLTLADTASLAFLEPCGAANPRPLFCMTDVRIGSLSAVGGGTHTKLQLEKNGRVFDAIWFGQRTDQLELYPGCLADAAFEPEINEFRGRRSVQLQIKALRWEEGAPWRGILEGQEGHGYRLDRGELGAIWRALEGVCPSRLALASLGELEPRLQPGQIALGLRVLAELSLVSLTIQDGGVRVELTRGERADLFASPAWRKHHR